MGILRFKNHLIALVLTLMGSSLTAVLVNSNQASALSGSQWNVSRIIDDTIFFNPYTMSPDDIQIFLNNMVPTCTGTNPTCLKSYSQDIPTMPADTYCSTINGGSNYSAATIIKTVAVACNMNPQAMLVLMQKEQILVTSTAPTNYMYQFATGFCVYDSTPPPQCAGTDGFFNQVYYAARQFQKYAKNPNDYNFAAGRTSYIQYNPSPSCGSSQVTVQNTATAGLYTYTPYQPNQAALNNLYGLGDGCSAYGNRNFWRLFNDWFGSTYSNDTFVSHPDGALLEMNNAIFLVDNHIRRHIRTPSIFDSYGYKWSEVRRAVAGDYSLPEGMPVDVIKPGKLFRTPTSSVYTMIWDPSSSAWVKQMVTYDAFINLGYRWDEVLVIPYAELPPGDYATALSAAQHPSETLIRAENDSRVYMLDTGTRRYLPRPEVLYSYNYWWTDIKTATAQDNLLPPGADMPYRESSVLYDGSNLYITDIPSMGDNVKRPIAPWECFSDRLSYRMNEVFVLAPDALPTGTGPIIYC